MGINTSTGSPSGEPPSVNERQAVSNRYDTVTNLAVYFNAKRSIVARAERETLIMRHVVAARLETTQQIALGLLLVLVGIVCLSVVVIVAIILLPVGIF